MFLRKTTPIYHHHAIKSTTKATKRAAQQHNENNNESPMTFRTDECGLKITPQIDWTGHDDVLDQTAHCHTARTPASADPLQVRANVFGTTGVIVDDALATVHASVEGVGDDDGRFITAVGREKFVLAVFHDLIIGSDQRRRRSWGIGKLKVMTPAPVNICDEYFATTTISLTRPYLTVTLALTLILNQPFH